MVSLILMTSPSVPVTHNINKNIWPLAVTLISLTFTFRFSFFLLISFLFPTGYCPLHRHRLFVAYDEPWPESLQFNTRENTVGGKVWAIGVMADEGQHFLWKEICRDEGTEILIFHWSLYPSPKAPFGIHLITLAIRFTLNTENKGALQPKQTCE